MAKKRIHRQVLAKLDPVAVARYQITEKDIRTIESYLKIIQKGVRGGSTWQDIIDFAGPYATSIVVHELTEIRRLETMGIQPLKLGTKALRATLAANLQAHVAGTYEEHLCLQEFISRTFLQHFELATLIKANRQDEEETDLQLFLESDLGVFILEDERVDEARTFLAQLKGENL